MTPYCPPRRIPVQFLKDLQGDESGNKSRSRRGMAELKTSRRSYGCRFSSGSSVNADILTARDPNGYKKEAEIGFFLFVTVEIAGKFC